MNWRPETWKNPYQHAASIPQNKFFNRDYDIYEAGADAILEALKKTGVRGAFIMGLQPVNIPATGTTVWISD